MALELIFFKEMLLKFKIWVFILLLLLISTNIVFSSLSALQGGQDIWRLNFVVLWILRKFTLVVNFKALSEIRAAWLPPSRKYAFVYLFLEFGKPLSDEISNAYLTVERTKT